MRLVAVLPLSSITDWHVSNKGRREPMCMCIHSPNHRAPYQDPVLGTSCSFIFFVCWCIGFDMDVSKQKLKRCTCLCVYMLAALVTVSVHPSHQSAPLLLHVVRFLYRKTQALTTHTHTYAQYRKRKETKCGGIQSPRGSYQRLQCCYSTGSPLATPAWSALSPTTPSPALF